MGEGVFHFAGGFIIGPQGAKVLRSSESVLRFGAKVVKAAFTVVISCMILANASDASELDSIQYQADGSLTFLVGNDPTPRFTREFQLVVSNCDWDVRVAVNDVKRIQYYDLVHKGDSIYHYTSYDKTPTNSGVWNTASAVADFGEFPVERGTFGTYVWLGLASSCYFHASSDGELDPIWTVHNPGQTKVKADVQVYDAPPFLPKRIIYHQRSGIQPPPFRDGWKGAEFQVVSETNIGSLKLPLEFAYEQFKPKADGASVDDLTSQFQVRVIVRHIMTTPAASVSPPVTEGRTLFEERRFASLPPDRAGAEYEYTNSQLPTVPEKIATEKYTMMSAAMGAVEVHRGNGVVKIAFLTFLVLSGVLFAMTILKTKTNKNSERKIM
jgi:hypothetical protein